MYYDVLHDALLNIHVSTSIRYLLKKKQYVDILLYSFLFIPLPTNRSLYSILPFGPINGITKQTLTGARYANINFGRTNLPLTFTIETATIDNFTILVCAITAWKNTAFLEFSIKLCVVAVNFQVIWMKQESQVSLPHFPTFLFLILCKRKNLLHN